MMILRCFHTAKVAFAPAVEKSALAKLRKATGYSFSKCKEALEKHSNDIKEAEHWLRDQAQAHGWEKATKLQGRATAQGLVSIQVHPDNAVMVETNCETDFVSRNKKFHSLVQKLTQGCFNFASEQPGLTGSTLLSKVPMSADQIANIPLAEGRIINDEVALSIGELGENIRNRRAIQFKATAPAMLVGYTHPFPEGGMKRGTAHSGRYGVVLAVRALEGSSATGKNATRVEEIGRQLCQHIVGMNPAEIGTLRPVEHAPEPPVETPVAPASPDTADSDETPSSSNFDDDETTLLNQEFLLDPDVTVGEYLIQNEVEVLDFARFECGEKIESSQHG